MEVAAAVTSSAVHVDSTPIVIRPSFCNSVTASSHESSSFVPLTNPWLRGRCDLVTSYAGANEGTAGIRGLGLWGWGSGSG